MSDATEYDCEGCGIHVVRIIGGNMPESHLCITCEFIDAHYWRKDGNVTAAMNVYKMMNPRPHVSPR